MAAFDRVSNIMVRPANRKSFIDFRTARLPNQDMHSEVAEGYDPYQNRKPLHPIKLWMAYLNLFRIGFGAGVLGIPLAISQIGIVLGSILSLFAGFLMVHTHHMLVWLMWISIFTNIRESCIIGTFMLLSQVGICTVFVLFTSQSLRDIMDWESATPALLVLVLPYLLLAHFMKTLRIVSYVSMLGNIMNFIGMILVFYHIFEDPHGKPVLAVTQALPVLFAFGSFLFNMSAIGVVLSVEKALLEPERMTERYGVVSVGIVVPVIVATIFGALGYWAFGVMDENVLRFLPFDSMTAMVAMALYLIAIAFSFPIQAVPAVAIIMEIIRNHDPMNEPSDKFVESCRMVIRPLFVLMSFVLAYLVPYQGPLVAFVGNLCTTMLALVFPALMEICLLYPGPYGKFNYFLYKDLLIILIGVFSWVFGVLLCGYLIYVRLHTSLTSTEIEIPLQDFDFDFDD